MRATKRADGSASKARKCVQILENFGRRASTRARRDTNAPQLFGRMPPQTSAQWPIAHNSALLSTVMRGPDPRIHLLAKKMDCRVKPGNNNRLPFMPEVREN